jgi:hypothetical protein
MWFSSDFSVRRDTGASLSAVRFEKTMGTIFVKSTYFQFRRVEGHRVYGLGVQEY